MFAGSDLRPWRPRCYFHWLSVGWTELPHRNHLRRADVAQRHVCQEMTKQIEVVVEAFGFVSAELLYKSTQLNELVMHSVALLQWVTARVYTRFNGFLLPTNYSCHCCSRYRLLSCSLLPGFLSAVRADRVFPWAPTLASLGSASSCDAVSSACRRIVHLQLLVTFNVTNLTHSIIGRSERYIRFHFTTTLAAFKMHGV